MDQFIELLLNQHISSVDINDTIEVVENTIQARRCDCVIVNRPDGNCFGIITNTDLARFHENHGNNKTVRAWEICAHRVIYVSEDSSIREISDLMQKNSVHHIVILANGVAKGYITSNDVSEYTFIQQHLK